MRAPQAPGATVYFDSYDQDLVASADQERPLPPDYVWIRRGLLHRAWSSLLYGICYLFGAIYLHLALHARVRNRDVLKRVDRSGFVVYCNHTQPVGDPFAAGVFAAPRRVYAVASPSNLGIPVLGRLLPAIGALPVPSDLRGMRSFIGAVRERLDEGCGVVVFPEAHVWPWHTGIRPMPASAFALAADANAPAFTLTTTYQERAVGAKPRATYYFDGPFYPDQSLSRRARQEDLKRQVFEAMTARSRESTYAYVRYQPASPAAENPSSRTPAASAPARATVVSDDGRVAVMYCGDQGVERGVLLSVLSLVRHTERPLDVYLLTMGCTTPERSYRPIGSAYAERLEGVLRREGRAGDRVSVVDLTEAFDAEPPTRNLGSRFTPCCMLRLYADLVPQLPERILYLDYDVVAHTDLEELLAIDLEGCEFAGAPDYYGRWFFGSRPGALDYVNSGVLLMNLGEMRRTGLLGRCRQRCASTRMFMPDQSALNELACAKRLLPRAYNEQRALRDTTVLRHFSTSFRVFPYPQVVAVKPWEVEKVHRVLKLHAFDDVLATYQSALPAVVTT